MSYFVAHCLRNPVHYSPVGAIRHFDGLLENGYLIRRHHRMPFSLSGQGDAFIKAQKRTPLPESDASQLITGRPILDYNGDVLQSLTELLRQAFNCFSHQSFKSLPFHIHTLPEARTHGIVDAAPDIHLCHAPAC